MVMVGYGGFLRAEAKCIDTDRPIWLFGFRFSDEGLSVSVARFAVKRSLGSDSGSLQRG